MGKRKVAICGTAPDSLADAPFDDPEVEIWGTSRLWKEIDHADVWVEVHPPEEIGRGWECSEQERKQRRQEHLSWLSKQQIPVYMQEEHPEIPGSIQYPLEDIREWLGEEFGDTEMYFTNSISYMMALALYQGVDEMGVYGVNMALASEYSDQRPSCEYFIGLARGMGVEVDLPPQSDLLKTTHLYGFEWEDRHQFTAKIDARKEELNGRIAEAKEELMRLNGLRGKALGMLETLEYVSENGFGFSDEEMEELEGHAERIHQQRQEVEQAIEQCQQKRLVVKGALENTDYFERTWSAQ